MEPPFFIPKMIELIRIWCGTYLGSITLFVLYLIANHINSVSKLTIELMDSFCVALIMFMLLSMIVATLMLDKVI